MQQPGLLRDNITSSFTFANDPDLAASLAASMRVVASGGSDVGSRPASITFQTGMPAGVVAAMHCH